MISPETAVGCPTCGAALGPYEVLCTACGARRRHLLPVEELPPRLRELHDIAEGAIAQASANISNAQKQGVRVDLPEDLLAMAQEAALNRDYPNALDLASKSGAEAENLAIQFEALQNRLRVAKRAMEVAREDGADLRDSEELLEMAHEAATAGDYKSAIRYTLKAIRRADRKRGLYQAWKVEISDFL